MTLSSMGLSVPSGLVLKNVTSPIVIPYFITLYTNESDTSSSAPITPMVIHGPPGGGSSPSTIKVTFFIFDRQSEIDLNDNYYGNDSSASLISGTSYSISGVKIGSEYSFYEWLADNGAISSSESITTNYVPSWSCTLTMILSRNG
ncbi:MAG: hypothetical protein AAE977_05980 [Thermoplasmataceae archaeon]